MLQSVHWENLCAILDKLRKIAPPLSQQIHTTLMY